MPSLVDGGLCGCCVSVAKWLPVAFITAIVSWSYYAYVVQLCFLTVADSDGWAVVILLLSLYHVVLGLFAWSYHSTVFSSPGRVPDKFSLSVPDMDDVETASDPRRALEQLAVEKDLPVFMRSAQAEVRYCSDCSHVKPDRCHHCSVCRSCVLKMDHHCPWVNNCVGFANYKFFLLFLLYATAYCLYVALSSLKYFLAFWSVAAGAGSPTLGKFHVLFLFFVSAMFCVSLTSLLLYHLFLVSRNMTTLESFRAPIFRHDLQGDRRAFHLGAKTNFQEVFGTNPVLWLLPVFTSFGDGLVYPHRGMDDPESGVGQELPCGRGMPWGRCEGEELVPMISATQFEDDDDDDTMRLQLRTRLMSTSSSSSSSTSGGSGAPAILDIEMGDAPATRIRSPGSRSGKGVVGELVPIDTV